MHVLGINKTSRSMVTAVGHFPLINGSFMRLSLLVLGFVLFVCHKASSEEKTIYAHCIGSQVRVRSAPALSAPTLGYLNREAVEIIGISTPAVAVDGVVDYWYEVKSFSGLQGWSFGRYLDSFPEWVSPELKQPCAVVRNPVLLREEVPLSTGTSEAIAAYRRSWQEFCDGRPGRPSIAQLWATALSIHIEFPAANISTETLHEYLLWRMYPSMIPAFDRYLPNPIAAYPPELGPSYALFASEKERGTQEDRLYFEILPHEPYNAPDWVESTGDYSGYCKYGAYDWVDHLKMTEDFLAVAKSNLYMLRVEKDQKEMLEELSGREYERDINACVDSMKETPVDTSAVLLDLERVERFLAARPKFRRELENLRVRIKKIRNGQIKVYCHIGGGDRCPP